MILDLEFKYPLTKKVEYSALLSQVIESGVNVNTMVRKDLCQPSTTTLVT